MKRRAQFEAIGIKAIYSLGELAAAAGVERRQLRRLLAEAGVQFMRIEKGYHYVPLSELELKVRPLWEGIRAAQNLAQEEP